MIISLKSCVPPLFNPLALFLSWHTRRIPSMGQRVSRCSVPDVMRSVGYFNVRNVDTLIHFRFLHVLCITMLVDKTTESIEGDSYANLFAEPTATGPTVAYTQYPRCCHDKNCTDFTRNKRCAFVKNTDFDYMGYSIRVDNWRYTEWARWNGTVLLPIWSASVPDSLCELYSHYGDNMRADTYERFENENVALTNPAVVKNLSGILRNFFAPK
eukprot:m.531465 g.531465  ORF g.531465 m.531465 type:complete len:213 (+) comp22035_c1_seq3:253-891(+)